MPSDRKVKRQFCCSRSRVEILWCAAPQSVCSNHSLKMQEQLHRLSLSRWTLPSRAATSSYPSTAATPATWAFFMWTDMPKVGQQTRRTLKASVTQEQQMPFSAWLSLTRCSYFPLPHPSRARDLQPDILHHPRSVLSWPDSSSALFALCYLPLKWGKKWHYLPLFDFKLCGCHKQGFLSLSITFMVFLFRGWAS